MASGGGLAEKVARSVRRRTLARDVRRRLETWRRPPEPLAPNPSMARGTASSYRLNALARLLPDAQSYLEIGVDAGRTFEAVQMRHRVAVEPTPRFSLDGLPDGVTVEVRTSDEFFADLDPGVVFDLVFVDGMHTYDQTYRDLVHVLEHSCPHTLVLVDDVVPTDRISAIRDWDESQRERARLRSDDERWHGDVFRLPLVLRDHHPELRVRTLVHGNGQAVVWRTSADVDVVPIGSEALNAYLAKSYDEVFAHGVPASFAPGSDEEVLADIARDLSGPGGQVPA